MRFIGTIATALALTGTLIVAGCSAGNTAGTQPLPVTALPVSGSAPVGIALLESAKKKDQWVQFGYDAGHTAYNPLEKIINAKNVSSLQVAWNNSSIVQPNGAIADKNLLYVDDVQQSAGGLYAIDATTGAQKWYTNVNLTWPLNHGTAVISGNVVVTPCSNGSSSPFLTALCGVKASSGKILWTAYCQQ